MTLDGLMVSHLSHNSLLASISRFSLLSPLAFLVKSLCIEGSVSPRIAPYDASVFCQSRARRRGGSRDAKIARVWQSGFPGLAAGNCRRARELRVAPSSFHRVVQYMYVHVFMYVCRYVWDLRFCNIALQIFSGCQAGDDVHTRPCLSVFERMRGGSAVRKCAEFVERRDDAPPSREEGLSRGGGGDGQSEDLFVLSGDPLSVHAAVHTDFPNTSFRVPGIEFL